MRKPPHSAAAEKLRAQVIIIDTLKLQMLRLMALRKEVAAAERANAATTKKKHKQAHLFPSLFQAHDALWLDAVARPRT